MNKQYLILFLLMTNTLNAMEKERVSSFENLAIDNQKNVTELLLHINNAKLFYTCAPMSNLDIEMRVIEAKSPDSSSYARGQSCLGVSIYDTVSKTRIAFLSLSGYIYGIEYSLDGCQLWITNRDYGYEWLHCYDLLPYYFSPQQKNCIQTLRHYIFAKTILDQRKTEFGLNEDGYSTWQAIKGAFGAYFKLLVHKNGKRWILKRLISSQIQRQSPLDHGK